MSKLSHAASFDFSNSKSRRPPPPLEDEPVDTGLIRCVCPSTEDDGFTIQCEQCLVWQHAYCVHITHETIPDHYLCDRCSKRKRPKLSKRIPISKKKLRKLDSEDDPSTVKKKKLVKSRIVSRYVYPIFKEAKERWNARYKSHQQQQQQQGPILFDHGPFVTMDPTTLLTKGVLMDAPVTNEGLFATRSIPSLRYLMEVTGDVLLKSEFKFDPINDFVLLGTPLSHIMFYPTLDLCIDTRQFGNKARYIRRSCHPNAELRNVVLSRDDKTIHLGLFARHLIEKGQEVTISWNWQRGHIAWKENMNWHHQHRVKQGQGDEGHQVIDEEEERRRKTTIKNMLDRFEKEFGSCACLNKRRCLIEQLKRQIAVPKEKPMPTKLPAVNILPAHKPGRRKSSVILLKPKPELDQVSNSRQLIISPTSSTTTTKSTKNGEVEEGADIDVTSNSPTLGNAKDASDDELLDVEGDIDIGDDLPVSSSNIKDTLPLLEDNSSEDEDNADLSSLSSLSSLSVFEESGNDMSDDDNGRRNRSKSRKRKSSSRHAKSSSSRSHENHHSHHRPASSSSATTPPVIERTTSPITPAALPRKKLWVRDYLNKHVTDQLKTPENESIKTEIENKALNLENSVDPNKNETTIIEQKSPPTNIISQPVVDDSNTNNDEPVKVEGPAPIENEVHTSKDVHVDTAPAQVEIPPVEEQKQEVIVENTEMDIDVKEENANVFDIDEGELSDASTILLDEEELQNVYNRPSAEVNPVVEDMAVDIETKESTIEETAVTKDDTLITEDIIVDDDTDLAVDDDTQPSVTVKETEEAVTVEESTTTVKEPLSSETTTEEEVTLKKDNSEVIGEEDDADKKSVKKISLQEYLLKQKGINS